MHPSDMKHTNSDTVAAGVIMNDVHFAIPLNFKSWYSAIGNQMSIFAYNIMGTTAMGIFSTLNYDTLDT